MPIYEYYCERCDKVFESLRSFSAADLPAPCSDCQREADRILPTTFATMSRKDGWRQRVPFHHKDVRGGEKKRSVASVKPKTEPKRSPKAKTKKD